MFAALVLGLSIFLAVRRAWSDAALWLAVAIFMACYGTIQLDLLPRWRALLLGIGLVAGGAALLIALVSVLSFR